MSFIMDTIQKKSKMTAFFQEHIKEQMLLSLGCEQSELDDIVEFTSKVGRIHKDAAMNMLKEDIRQASKLVDILREFEKHKKNPTADKPETDKLENNNNLAEITTNDPMREITGPLTHSTFNIPEAVTTYPNGSAG